MNSSWNLSLECCVWFSQVQSNFMNKNSPLTGPVIWYDTSYQIHLRFRRFVQTFLEEYIFKLEGSSFLRLY